ncbi:unnamed protein product [Trichobilharzia szidati]|nr:unnamed protein product [Trichobilharzia szidati]
MTNLIYDLPEQLRTVKLCSPLIFRSQFKEYLNESLSSSSTKQLLIDQFNMINTKSCELEKANQLTCRAAVHPDNYYLNRYDDILPYDQTRVVLRNTNNQNPISFSELSTNLNVGYINANFIRTIEPPISSNDTILRANNQCEFIATQGPIKSTISDFWYMIYTFKCPIIVMLTKLQCNNQTICHLYWPEKLNTVKHYKSANYQMAVSLLEVNQSDCFTKRIFKVSLSKNPGESHNVIHIHFTKWENFGVPTTENMWQLVKEYDSTYQSIVKRSSVSSIGPTVVHCSAGVGRTGTFISVLIVHRHLRSPDCEWITLASVVLMLRLWRCCMIELKDQYIFLHEYFAHILNKEESQLKHN